MHDLRRLVLLLVQNVETTCRGNAHHARQQRSVKTRAQVGWTDCQGKLIINSGKSWKYRISQSRRAFTWRTWFLLHWTLTGLFNGGLHSASDDRAHSSLVCTKLHKRSRQSPNAMKPLFFPQSAFAPEELHACEVVEETAIQDHVPTTCVRIFRNAMIVCQNRINPSPASLCFTGLNVLKTLGNL